MLEKNYVQNMANDWSHWDDAYNYVQDKNPGFPKKEMPPSVFESLNLDLIAFWGKSNKRLIGLIYDEEKKNQINYPEEIDHFVREYMSFNDKNPGPDQFHGLISTPHGMIILAASKVTDSASALPPKGIVVMGRIINKSLIDRLKTATQIDANIIPLEEVEKNSLLRKYYYMALNSPENFISNPIDDKFTNAFSVLKDSYNKPIGLISTNSERKIMTLGFKTKDTLLWTLCIVGLITVVIIYLFANRVIVSRLIRLKNELEEITRSENFNSSVTSRSDDEISYVANQINNMFSVINQAHSLLEKRVEERTRSLNKSNAKLLKEISERQAIEDELIAHKDRLSHLAHFDVLTGLPNRLMLNDQINSTLIDAKINKSKFALLFVDLDRFKAINDAKGHDTGDFVLRTIAERIRNLRSLKGMVARIGGDEFIVMLPNITKRYEIDKLCKEILNVCTQPIHDNHNAYYLSASIGVSIYPDHGMSLEELQKNADIAMYRSKVHNPGNYVYFEEKMKHDATASIELEDLLHRALENDEFRLHFQPKFDLKTGEIVGSEALIRWESPKLGFVSPSIFIPYAERSGLILPIGQWVIDECCRFILKMKSKGIDHLTTAVNFSPVQFNRQDVVSLLDQVVRKHGITSQDIEVEITENAILNDTNASRKKLFKLKDMGFKIAIDDFGAGATSLQHLKTFPIDCLKIDKCFVDGIPKSAKDIAIVESLINLAHRLGIQVVAEGIENASQAEFLSIMDCDIAQGYYFAKPMIQDHFLFEIEKMFGKKVKSQ